MKKTTEPKQMFVTADEVFREFMPTSRPLESEPPKGIDEEAQAFVDSLLVSVRNKGPLPKHGRKRLTR